MTLDSRPVDQNHVDDERSLAAADQRARGEQPAQNLWSTISHHTSSWSRLWRLLVLAIGLAALTAAGTTLMWLLGMRIGIAGFEVAPA